LLRANVPPRWSVVSPPGLEPRLMSGAAGEQGVCLSGGRRWMPAARAAGRPPEGPVVVASLLKFVTPSEDPTALNFAVTAPLRKNVGRRQIAVAGDDATFDGNRPRTE